MINRNPFTKETGSAMRKKISVRAQLVRVQLALITETVGVGFDDNINSKVPINLNVGK